MELVDTHCHLDAAPLCDDLEGVLGRARQAEVTRVIVPGYDTDTLQTAGALAGRPGIWVALGLHPWVAAEPLDLDLLEQRLRSTGAVAVGEIGLDYAVEGPIDKPRQRDVFARQLALARKLGLPVILHCRRAFDDLIAILREHAPVPGVMHAFSRGPELAERLWGELDLHLAFGGTVTRPRADRARRSAAAVPEGRLLLETDAPSIGLDGVPPERTEPHHVREVARAVAELRGTTIEHIAGVTTTNARALFVLA